MSGPVWRPVDWSVYMHAVRTNNDVEGYHHAVNRRAGKTQIGFYLLIQVLYEESRLTKLNIRLVNEGKLCRYQRKKYKKVQGILFTWWNELCVQDITPHQLLKRCAHLTRPMQWMWHAHMARCTDWTKCPPVFCVLPVRRLTVAFSPIECLSYNNNIPVGFFLHF